MTPSTPPNAGSERSRLRLVVVRVLVFSLFATLFARLYYLQVVSRRRLPRGSRVAVAARGRRPAPARPDRRRPGPARWSPTARRGWSRSTAPCSTGSPPTTARSCSAGSRPRWTPRCGASRHALVTCGDPGSVRGRCWNGSPYQPVPVALDVRQSVALRILEQPEDYPAVVAQQQSLRAYPSPYGVNLADIVGYLSPITAGELRPRPKHARHVAQRREHRGPGRRRAGVRPLPARPARLPAGRRRLDGPGARQRRQGRRPARRHPGHLDRRQGAGHHRARAGRRRSAPPARRTTR